MNIFRKVSPIPESIPDQAAPSDAAREKDDLSCECCGATVLNGRGLCNYCSNRFHRLEQKPVWRTPQKDKGYLYQ